MLQVQQLNSLKEAIDFAKSLNADVNVYESPSDYPHGKYHAIYPQAHDHFIAMGYELKATLRLKIEVKKL